MRRKKWMNSQKTLIVLAGLQGQSIAEICAEHGISQAQYYKWKDQFLQNASRAFESDKTPKQIAQLQAENDTLKRTIGELHLDLKKMEKWL